VTCFRNASSSGRPEDVGEDVAVALAVEPRAVRLRQGGQAVPVHEDRERLRVQRHVVHQRAVQVEDDAPRLQGPSREND
jgi:hypothetical protein